MHATCATGNLLLPTLCESAIIVREGYMCLRQWHSQSGGRERCWLSLYSDGELRVFRAIPQQQQRQLIWRAPVWDGRLCDADTVLL